MVFKLTRISLFVLLTTAALCLQAVEPSEVQSQRSVFWNEEHDPFYRFSFIHIPTSWYDSYGRRGQLEFSGNVKLFRFDGFAGGTLNVSAQADLFMFNGDAGIAVPDQLFRICAQPVWTRHCQNDISVLIHAEPGIYNDMKRWTSRTLFVPFGAALIKDYDYSLSGMIGLDLRHDFGTKLIPVAAFQWAPFETVRMKFGIPESSVSLYLPHISIYGGLDWQNVSFRKKRDSSRDSLVTVEDYRLYAGIIGWVTDGLHVFLEAGRVFGREISVGHDSSDPADSVEIENAQMIRIGFGGPF